MIYLTVRNTSGGNHGHQLKDLIWGITIAKVFGFEYVHTYYPYLEFFGLGFNEKEVNEINEEMNYLKFGGPFWGGINFENATKLFGSIENEYKDRDCLISIENALRIFPHQTVKWLQEGLIKRNVLENVLNETTEKFSLKHKNRKSSFDLTKINMAIHINRGQDYDKEKFPDHFANHYNVRYMFPMEYWENIVNLLKETFADKDYLIHIYTEQLNSEEIVKAFEGKDNVVLHIGANRAAGDNSLAHNIFFDFVSADLLVVSNSSFSAIASYFRNDKLTIYHPHAHLDDMPKDRFLATEENGNFDIEKLKNYFSSAKSR